MELKKYFTTVFIIFVLIPVPALSKGRWKPTTSKLNTEIYGIDYRGPESHFNRPPPIRSSHPMPHGESKRPSTEKARKKVKKVHG